MNIKCILFTGPGEVSLGKALLPDPLPGELLVENILTGISPGTELRCLSGVAEGKGLWPYIPGYAAVGRVIATGPETSTPVGAWVFHLGTKRVEGPAFLWGGHSSHALTTEANCHLLPSGVDLTEAVSLRLASISYNGLVLARPQPHETVAVVGLGPIGHLAARLYALAGCRVLGIDPIKARVDLLNKSGVQAIESGDDLLTRARSILRDGADIVVDSTGASSVTTTAVELLRGNRREIGSSSPSLRYVLQGSYASDVSFPYRPFFMREANLLVPKADTPSVRQAVTEMLVSKRLSLANVVSEIVEPSRCKELYNRLNKRDESLLTAAFRWAPGERTS